MTREWVTGVSRCSALFPPMLRSPSWPTGDEELRREGSRVPKLPHPLWEHQSLDAHPCVTRLLAKGVSWTCDMLEESSRGVAEQSGYAGPSSALLVQSGVLAAFKAGASGTGRRSGYRLSPQALLLNASGLG